jgi:NTP pyrophosphatase (non-canonical NTP hydrolase)
MLTDRGRQKGKTKEAIRAEMSNELADVFGYLLAFAAQEGVDLPDALAKKWFAYLKR